MLLIVTAHTPVDAMWIATAAAACIARPVGRNHKGKFKGIGKRTGYFGWGAHTGRGLNCSHQCTRLHHVATLDARGMPGLSSPRKHALAVPVSGTPQGNVVSPTSKSLMSPLEMANSRLPSEREKGQDTHQPGLAIMSKKVRQTPGLAYEV